MGLFDKIFKRKPSQGDPDNSRLLELINIFWKENERENSYKNVVLELMNGNSFLMLPTENDSVHETNDWATTQQGATVNLASVINLDGLKVLGAFTDEQAMLSWTKRPNEYTSMRSQDVLKICEENNINRIVINSDQPNMFVVERGKENTKEYEIKKDADIQLGTPNRPLSNSIIHKLLDNFRNNDTVLEVYQYGQTKHREFSIVLGFRLSVYSDNAKQAVINTVQNALQNETPDQTLDLFFIDTEEWYDMIRKVENSLIYKGLQ